MSYRTIFYMVCVIMALSMPQIKLWFTLQKRLPQSCFLQHELKVRLYFQMTNNKYAYQILNALKGTESGNTGEKNQTMPVSNGFVSGINSIKIWVTWLKQGII